MKGNKIEIKLQFPYVVPAQYEHRNKTTYVSYPKYKRFTYFLLTVFVWTDILNKQTKQPKFIIQGQKFDLPSAYRLCVR